MLADQDVKYLLRQWAAALDTDERTRVENELSVKLHDGVPVDAHCMDDAGNRIGLIGAWVERRAELTDGGLHFTVSLPPEAEGADVKRLILHGPREDGSMGYAAIPMGKVEGGNVEVRLSAKAVKNCPINLDQATVAGMELVPQPWSARLLARGAEVVHVARSAWEGLGDWFAGLAGGSPSDAVLMRRMSFDWSAQFEYFDLAAATNSAGEDQEYEHDDGILVTTIRATPEGEVFITVRAKDEDLDQAVVVMPVEVTLAPGRQLDQVFIVLTRDDGDEAPWASIELRARDMPINQERVPMIVEDLAWSREDLEALRWSAEIARKVSSQEALVEIAEMVMQLPENH